MKKTFCNLINIAIEIDGKRYSGYYTEYNGLITVYYKFHSKKTQKSLYNNAPLAKTILRELVIEFGDS